MRENKTCPGSPNHLRNEEGEDTMNRYRSYTAWITACGAVLIAAGSLLAVPGMINYQGLLLDDGAPVQGTKSVQFRIYDSAEGGTSLWEEFQSVAFSDGVFSVLLG